MTYKQPEDEAVNYVPAGRTTAHLPPLTKEWFQAVTTPRTYDERTGGPIYALTPPRNRADGVSVPFVVITVAVVLCMMAWAAWALGVIGR